MSEPPQVPTTRSASALCCRPALSTVWQVGPPPILRVHLTHQRPIPERHWLSYVHQRREAQAMCQVWRPYTLPRG